MHAPERGTAHGQHRVLVTGGGGFVGAHVCLCLLQRGHHVVVLDNFSTATRDALDNLPAVAGRAPVLYEGDIRNIQTLRRVFELEHVTAVVHLAAFSVSICLCVYAICASPAFLGGLGICSCLHVQSSTDSQHAHAQDAAECAQAPLPCYTTNVGGSLSLLTVMGEYGCKRLVYASSASVYGNAGSAPIDEGVPVCPLSPLAASKAAVEAVLEDLGRADAGWHVAVLRLFEVVGGHSSGILCERRTHGEFAKADGCGGTMAALARVARGEERSLRVHGNKLPTPDGTPVRDYVHVMDVAEAFVAALFALDVQLRGVTVLNLGTGKGASVLELADTFARAHSVEIPHVVYPACPREPPVLVADVQRAQRVLQWQPRRALLQMCVDAHERDARL